MCVCVCVCVCACKRANFFFFFCFFTLLVCLGACIFLSVGVLPFWSCVFVHTHLHVDIIHFCLYVCAVFVHVFLPYTC